MLLKSMVDTAYVSIDEYTKMQTKFNEIVEENDDTYPTVREALKSVRSDWMDLHGHPLIGWQGLTDVALVIKTRFPEVESADAMGINIVKEEMSPIPYTMTTIKHVHDAALKQLINVPKETVKINSFVDLLALSTEIVKECRRGVGNYVLINPRFVDDYNDLMSLISAEDHFTVVSTELMPDDKRCGMVVYKGSNGYDAPVFNAVFEGTGYSCLHPDVEKYVRKFEW